MTGSRNGFGLNDTTGCCRTIKGEKFIRRGGGTATARIAAYTAAWVRCRRFADDLYIREAGRAKAIDVDGEVSPDYWQVKRSIAAIRSDFTKILLYFFSSAR